MTTHTGILVLGNDHRRKYPIGTTNDSEINKRCKVI